MTLNTDICMKAIKEYYAMRWHEQPETIQTTFVSRTMRVVTFPCYHWNGVVPGTSFEQLLDVPTYSIVECKPYLFSTTEEARLINGEYLGPAFVAELFLGQCPDCGKRFIAIAQIEAQSELLKGGAA